MKKRPPPIQETGPSEDGIKITDTMTLVLRDSQGQEQRVKDSGIVARPQVTPTPIEGIMNKILYEDLKVGEKLGAGSQGTVRKATHRVTGQKYAIKQINLGDDHQATKQVLERELQRIAAIRPLL